MSASGRGRAVVIGTDTRAFLAVVRSLGRSGVEVHTVSTAAQSPARRSRYIAKAHELPPYRPGENDWLEGLRELLGDGQTQLLIPCPEWAVDAVDGNRDALTPHCKLALPAPAALHTFLDKRLTRELAERVDVRVPKEWRLAELGDLARLAAEPLPLVVKPPSSLNPADPYNKRMVVKAYSRTELERVVADELVHGQVFVQENVLGNGVGVELLVDDGEVVGAFQHERVHEPLHGGGSSYRRSVAVDRDLLAASERLVAAVSYTGVAMVEFKQCADGRWWLMEVNPRFWGSLPLAIAAGADFPAGLYDLLVDGKRPSWRPREGIYCRNLLADARWWTTNLRADREDPTLATTPPVADLAASVGRLLLGRERADTFTLEDPGPGLAELRDIGERASRKLRRRILGLAPARALLRRRARRALAQADSVLFVCKGNVCRSPFAAEALRRLRPDVSVMSSGYFPKPHRPSPELAIQAARSLGIDLGAHSSSVLSEELLHEAGAIFVFDLENHDTLSARYGVARRRLHLLGALDASGGIEIEDPWGKDRAAFDAVYRRIVAALDG